MIRWGWLSALAGDAATRDRLSETRQIADMLRVEAAYARAAGQCGKVPAQIGEAAADAIPGVRIDLDALATAAARDGVPVPALVRQIKDQVPAQLHPAVHAGLTSQDVTDTAMCLALHDILEAFEARIVAVQAGFSALSDRFGDRPLMGRTRMQAALPVGVAHRIAQWSAPWPDHLDRLAALRPRLLRLQLGGPVGTRQSFEGYGDVIAAEMARDLGLIAPPQAWHSQREALAELAGWLALVMGSLGKMGADLTLMAQQGIDTARIAGGGDSSAMAHKANPVRAELLVALARFGAGAVAGMQGALIHEQERSGAGWTLEWLVLPDLIEGCGGALRLGVALLSDIEDMGEPDRP